MKISEQDIQDIEQAVFALYRTRHDEAALRLACLALRLRDRTGFIDNPYGNVIPFPGHSVKV